MTKDECTEMVEVLFQGAKSAYNDNGTQTWWIYAAFTDQLLLDEWTPGCNAENTAKSKENLLLELRVFCEDAEYRLIRGNIGSDLKYRICNEDNRMKEDVDYFDEWQYLDINSKNLDIDASNEEEQDKTHCTVVTTGGGVYTIPFSKEKLKQKDEKTERKFADILGVKIRNYLSYYEETGQAYVSDWRMLELGRVRNHGER